MLSANPKTIFRALIATAVLISLVLPHSVQAQMKVKTMTNDDIFMIPGLGAVIAPEDGKLKVLIVPDDCPKEYASVDIESGDYLLMVNGKRVKTIDDLREVFKGIEVGETLEMGLKRDKTMLIASMKRASDDDTGGKMMMMTRTITTDEEGAGEGGMEFQGGAFSISVVPEVGIAITAGDNGLSVVGLMPAGDEEMIGDQPGEGDIVISIQGKTVETIDEFESAYEAIKTGDKVSIEYKHNDELRKLSFTKMEIEQKIMMKSN